MSEEVDAEGEAAEGGEGELCDEDGEGRVFLWMVKATAEPLGGGRGGRLADGWEDEAATTFETGGNGTTDTEADSGALTLTTAGGATTGAAIAVGCGLRNSEELM